MYQTVILAENQFSVKNIFRFFSPLFFLFFSSTAFFPGNSFCQEKDPVKTGPDTSRIKKHSPRVAAILSAAVPGLGQVYNKKYWKVPIVYGGLITAGYFLDIYRDAYHDLKKAYIAEIDTDSTTFSIYNMPVASLQSYMEFYHTRMEICYIALGLVYVLNIVDASVDAHLFSFDVSDDLSLRIMPEIKVFSDKTPYTGLRLTLRL